MIQGCCDIEQGGGTPGMAKEGSIPKNPYSEWGNLTGFSEHDH